MNHTKNVKKRAINKNKIKKRFSHLWLVQHNMAGCDFRLETKSSQPVDVKTSSLNIEMYLTLHRDELNSSQR